MKVAVIGAGYLGAFHAEKYAGLPGAELVAVADLQPERAAELAARLGTRAVTDYREILPLVQAVSIAVPRTTASAVPISPRAAIAVYLAFPAVPPNKYWGLTHALSRSMIRP